MKLFIKNVFISYKPDLKSMKLDFFHQNYCTQSVITGLVLPDRNADVPWHWGFITQTTALTHHTYPWLYLEKKKCPWKMTSITFFKY